MCVTDTCTVILIPAQLQIGLIVELEVENIHYVTDDDTMYIASEGASVGKSF